MNVEGGTDEAVPQSAYSRYHAGMINSGTSRARAAALATVALALAGCSTTRYRPVSDTPVVIGKPYTIRGTTYRPAADANFDVLGYASWYGSESGNRVALGERFRPEWITAAHTTLPLPTYVEVTALETGRTILVRINDRGPFARGRILDLSRGAAEQLGIRRTGVAAVRVRRVDPPEKERARLRKGRQVAERPRLSDAALASLRAQLAAGVRQGLVQAP
ncbi:rare lipoprotein A [Sphingomonas sp. OV641]|nr:rare lipoprotein A [Sphingomonas sp. OV641]